MEIRLRPLIFTSFASVLLLGSGRLQAGGISLSQSVDRTETGYDDRVEFTITLKWDGSPNSYLVEGPIRPILDRLKVSSTSSTVTVEGKGANEVTTKHFRFYLEPTSSGVGRIERIEITYLHPADSIEGSVFTDPLEITIARPVVSTKEEQSGVPMLVLAGAGLVLISALGGGLFYRHRRRMTAPEPLRSPEEKLLDGLTQLKGKVSADHKQFQTGLYRLLTDYLFEKHEIGVHGKSCQAIIDQFAEADIPVSHREKISEWLRRAEKEKYSPAGAPPGETMRIESEVREFFQAIRS